MTTFLKTVLNSAIYFSICFVVWTCLGQIPVKGMSLEKHYHQAVNSQKFQTGFWTLATPVTWTKAQVESLVGKWIEKKRQAKESLAR